jgi:hypothetical protein
LVASFELSAIVLLQINPFYKYNFLPKVNSSPAEYNDEKGFFKAGVYPKSATTNYPKVLILVLNALLPLVYF